ncbi:MAG: hypothetical protein WBA93_23120 [Microcoleaceae cyanobacterium]
MIINKIHLWQEETQTIDGFAKSSITLEYPNNQRQTLWYRLPIKYQEYLTDSCDPFVIATIFLAMSRGHDLIIHGQVSPSLLDNLEEFQAVWSSWRSNIYRRISINANIEREQERIVEKEIAISAFSGGVDSCFTAYRHVKGMCGRRKRNLQASLMIHGFDIPIQEEDVFKRAFLRSQKMTSSLDLELISVATNFRQVIKLPWEDIFGTGIASCLHLFSKRYAIGLIPASYTYRTTTFPYGSNAITDPLLSSEACKIFYDGAIASRFEKIQQLLDWPEAVENFRVCWQGEQKDRNCCRCEKCIRNILIFRALDYGLPPCFQEDVSDRQILNLRVKGGGLDALKSVGRAVKIVNKQESWVKALNQSIRRNQILAFLEKFVPSKWKKLLVTIKYRFYNR